MKIVFGLHLLFIPLWSVQAESSQPPHIIFIYADDLGWNDVSFHGSPEIPTPNIDALALNGIILNNYYGEWLCTPSRAAFLSGRYPIRTGLQHSLIKAGEDTVLPLDVVTLPQHLKRLGYSTHIIGKWHLGCSKTKYMPTKRGFDSFLGYLNAYIGYYDFTGDLPVVLPNIPFFFGIDLRNGTELVKNFRGRYTPYVFADQAKNVILNHDTSKPMFLYLAQLAVHLGNPNQKYQAPPEIVSKFKYIKDKGRRFLAAIMSTLDDSVGTVFEALHQKDMLKNSIVLFVSDNGGETSAGEASSSNYPLRGQKHTFWEGGVRLPAVIWSPLLNLSRPRVSDQLMHATDWMPTFYKAAGGNPADLEPIDGHDMWEALKDDLPSPRKDLLNTLDPIEGLSAYRLMHFKVVNGTTPMELTGWYGPSGFEYTSQPPSMYQHVFRNGSTIKDILIKSGWWIVEHPDQVYLEARVTCTKPPPPQAEECDPVAKPCLFNVVEDPCEYYDVADQHPRLVNMMMNQILEYEKNSMKPQSKPSDYRADPMCHGFAHVPWLDPENAVVCDYLQNLD